MTTAAESKNPKISLEQPKHDSSLDQISMTIAGDTPIGGESIVSSPPTLAVETVSEGTESKATVTTDSVVSSDNVTDKGEIPATDVEKKIRRAERFGVPVQLSEQEKRNTRAERFGTASTASEPVKNSEDQKRKSRAERFGTSVPATATATADDEAKKKARLERFASASTPNTTTTTVEDEKRKARAIRFSQPTGSISQVNGEGDIKKTAIAGNGT